MPSINELQTLKASLDAQIAQALVQEAELKKQKELARTKAREAEIAKGLKEVANLMRQYRLSKEHLFKAAQSAPPPSMEGPDNSELLKSLNPDEIREDVRFEFERGAASKEPAKRMSIEEMRQFYERLDAVEPQKADTKVKAKTALNR